MQVYSWIYDGVAPRAIHVEYHARFQIPSFSVLGLPGPEIQEARERIIAAFHASGIEFPKKKLIINLAPASMKKWGTGHDLAIAIAILHHALDLPWPPTVLAWGELGLQGEIKARGQMAALIDLLTHQSIDALILSPLDADQLEELLAWRSENHLPLPKIRRLIRLEHLRDVAPTLQNSAALPPQKPRTFAGTGERDATAATPALLSLPASLERTLEIALTGRHHLLLLGPKGIGKSQSLEWLKATTPAPPPALSWRRALRDPMQSTLHLGQTPIRQVHSQVRPAHLLGSWRSHSLESGELALAHGGILIADEFLEWPRDSRECLREPLQSKRFLLSRVAGKTQIDCDFQLVATGNLCPCGGLPAQFHVFLHLPPETLKKWRCRCHPREVQQYWNKVSGPIADRIDLLALLSDLPDPDRPPQSSAAFAARIHAQQAFARDRLGRLPSELTPQWIEAHLPRTPKIRAHFERLPSLRSRHKTARIAYTLQSIDQTDELKEEHVFEASAYRLMDRLDSTGSG